MILKISGQAAMEVLPSLSLSPLIVSGNDIDDGDDGGGGGGGGGGVVKKKERKQTIGQPSRCVGTYLHLLTASGTLKAEIVMSKLLL